MRTKIVFKPKLEEYESIKQSESNTIIINSTTRCNSNCIHCYNTKALRERGTGDDLPFSLVKKILIEGKTLGMKAVVFTGGEPLIREDLLDIMKFSKDLGYYNVLITNGYLLTKQTADQLMELSINRIQISLDGFEKTNDYLRGFPGHFQKTTENMKYLIKNNFYISIASVVLEKNYQELPKLFTFFKKKGISEYRIMRYIPLSSHMPIKVKENYFDIYLEVLSKVFKSIETDNVGIDIEDPPLSIKPILPTKLENKIHYTPCRGLYNTITIESNGRIALCPIYTKDVDYGNVKTQSLKQIIEKTYEKAKAFNSLSKFCNDCEYFDQCKGGCRCSAFYNACADNKPDPFCIKQRKYLKNSH